MLTRHLVFAVAAAVALPCPGFADLVVAFDVRTEHTAMTGTKQVKGKDEGTTTERVTVRLGNDYVQLADTKKSELIDFHSRMVTIVSKPEKTYFEFPLLSSLGFISAEFDNRLMQAGLFDKLEMKDNPMDPVLMEHLFSLRAPKSVPLQGHVKGNTESWLHGRKPLFSCATGGQKLSAGETRAFIRYLRHEYGIHPDILSALAKREIIPNRMEIRRYNMQVEHFSLVLVKCERTNDGFDRAGFLAGATRTQDELATLCEKAGRLKGAAYDAACAKLREEGVAQRDAGNHFDAILLLLEYGLCSDQLQPNDIFPLKDVMQNSDDCQMLFSSIMPQSKEHAEQCLKDLQSLEARTERGKRVLRIFQANILNSLGRAEEAKATFIAVLKENPVNAGAWKDLGDIFYNQYEMATAWGCWDVTRNLRPTHKNFIPVLELEKKLTTTYPEFL